MKGDATVLGIAPQCVDSTSEAGIPRRRAAFLDRDGTIVVDAHYLARPDQLRLIPGADEAIRQLNAAGVPVVIVTNQSGIARGYFSADDYCVVQRAMREMLLEAGAIVTAFYHCPHHPEFTGPCICRKPGTALYHRAASDHGLELAGSLFVGDRWRDVEPALTLDGVGVLVPANDTSREDIDAALDAASVTGTLGEAVERYLKGSL